jgi:hypothetical protein
MICTIPVADLRQSLGLSADHAATKVNLSFDGEQLEIRFEPVVDFQDAPSVGPGPMRVNGAVA